MMSQEDPSYTSQQFNSPFGGQGRGSREQLFGPDGNPIGMPEGQEGGGGPLPGSSLATPSNLKIFRWVFFGLGIITILFAVSLVSLDSLTVKER